VSAGKRNRQLLNMLWCQKNVKIGPDMTAFALWQRFRL